MARDIFDLPGPLQLPSRTIPVPGSRVVNMGPRQPVDASSSSADVRASSPAGFELASILSAARKGDRNSLGELFSHYRRYLLLLATTQMARRLRSRVSPSDVVQETMLKAHQHFGQFQGASERELLGWLRQILVTSLARFAERNILAAKRDMRREASVSPPAADGGKNPPFVRKLWAGGPSPSGWAQNREESHILAQRLAQLPARYRAVLVLRNIQGLSFDEVAAQLNRSPGATRMLWLRAIEKLRALYRKAEQHDS